MQVTSMKVGDLFPRPRLRLQADGVGVDLSEAVSVTARVRLPGSTSHVDRDVTVADQDVTANHGIVTVVLIDGDTDFQGTIKFDIEVEWATGVQTWPSRGYFKIWLLEDADSAQGGGPPLVGSSGDPFTLDRIYDVNISSAADNDLLQYDSASARWLNVAPADVRSTLGLGSAALSSTTDFIRSSVTQAGAALTPTAQTLWSFQPADTNRGPFQWVMGGAAFDSVFDPVMYLGYNVADGGGVAKSGEASFRTALESHYRNGGVNNFEYYFEYMSGDLVTRRRPFFLQMDKSTGAVNSMQFSANTAYFTQESDEAPYFTISRGNITSAPYAGTPIEWRIKAASAQNSVFTMENSTSVALTIETLTEDSAVLRAGSIANENLYLFNNRGIAVNVQDNAAALTVMGGAVGPVAVFRAGSVAGNLTTWQDNASSVLASVSSAGLATFAGLTLSDATNLVFGTSTGTRIGTATSQKLGFYNATPIIRPSGSILTALSNLGLVGSPTLASTALSDTSSIAYLASANTFTAGQTVAGSTDTQQLIVKGAVGQTVGLQHWRNSADTTLAYISAVGYAQFAGISSTANAFIDGSADNIQLRVQGHSVQNAALQTWETSAGTVVGSVSGSGAFTSNINSGVYWSGGASFTGTPNPGLTVINRNPGGYDPLIQAQAATSTGALKTVFAFGAVGTGNWADATVANQISDFYILTRSTGDALVERLRISSAGVVTTKGQNFIDGSSDQIQLRVQGHSSQTADFLTVETSAGTKLGGWDRYGQLNTQYLTDLTGASPYLRLQSTSLIAINQGNVANTVFAVRGMASQSGALTIWQDSASTTLASVSAAGLGTFAGLVSSTTGAFTGDVTVGAGSAAIDALLTINGGTNTGKGSAIAFKRGGSSKGYLGTRSFVIGGSTDDISLISYTDLTLGIGSQILMAMSSSANTLNAYSSTAIPLVAKGFSAQTANLQEWQNSAGTVLLSVDSGGALVGGSPVSVKLWNRTVQGTGGGSLYIGGSATGAATDGVVIDGNATTFSTGVTSGEWSSLRVGQNNNPNASSTAIHNAILVSPTINYASGGAGSYNALRIKVTETALPSGANYLIYASAGAAGTTEKFSITNAGLGTFAGGVSLADASDLTIGTTTGSKIGQASSKIGFFNATPVAKPTGVAVDAASIHAALVSLGLISA